MSKFSQGQSSTLLPAIAVHMACLKTLEHVFKTRAEYLEEEVAKVQASRFKWVERLVGPITRNQALRIISTTPGYGRHRFYAWGVVEECERLAALSMAVMPSGIMCVTASDFERIAQFYRPEVLPC